MKTSRMAEHLLRVVSDSTRHPGPRLMDKHLTSTTGVNWRSKPRRLAQTETSGLKSNSGSTTSPLGRTISHREPRRTNSLRT